MNFVTPTTEELSYVRADPLLWKHGVPLEVGGALDQAIGKRAGIAYWRSRHDHLYALTGLDDGRGRAVSGYWGGDSFRPPEHEINADLLDFCSWVATYGEDLNARQVWGLAPDAGRPTTWAEGSVLRTSETRFVGLPDFPYAPQYIEVEGLRMAYIEHGTGDPILLLHGEPTWGFLYRHMIPPLGEVGRVIVPDLIGFGRSDKPRADHAYSYLAHVRWLRSFITQLDLRAMTLVCQDWGGLLGLRVLAQIPKRFARVVAMNTAIPDGRDLGPAFMRWRRYVEGRRALALPALIRRAVRARRLSDAELAAYEAPFPSASYQMGALMFPRLVPIRSDDPGAYDNRVAIEALRSLTLPVLLPWADQDPITGPWQAHLREIFQAVAPPLIITGAGHFLQEDAGLEIADHIRRWMATTR